MAKRRHKRKPADSSNASNINGTTTVQQSVERKLLIDLQRDANAAIGNAPVISRHLCDGDEYAGISKDNGKAEEKEVKQKKQNKPKVTVAKSAAKIDAADLHIFLVKNSEIMLVRLAGYFDKAFSAVSSAQFPWLKLFREKSIAEMTDIPLSHISDDVYRESKDWINQQPIEALNSFVLWSLDCISQDLESKQANSENSKNVAHYVSSKSQVGIFVTLAIVLRKRPDALVNVLPTLRETSYYQGQDMLIVVAWMVLQVSQGDLAVGLYSWALNLLPTLNGNSYNRQFTDKILQIVEVILSSPNSQYYFESGVIRNGERLIPPSALEILIQVAFPPSSAKATKRIQAIYFTLKKVALAGSKVMKEEAWEIISFAIQAARESDPRLSSEVANICTWCLAQNAECYKVWDAIYLDNPEVSVAILKTLFEDSINLHLKYAPLYTLRETLKNFRHKNEKAIASGENVALFKKADKYCKMLLTRSSWVILCLGRIFGFFIPLPIVAGLIYLYVNSRTHNRSSIPFL